MSAFKYYTHLTVMALMASGGLSVAQSTPSLQNNGLFFGGSDDPVLSKGIAPLDKDLQLDLKDGGVFSIFTTNSLGGADSTATFRAGEGHSSMVTAGKWYRIAKCISGSKRASALFSLRAGMGGSHENITFRTGMSYNRSDNMSFTLLSSSRYISPAFSDVRYVSTNAHHQSEFFLEVKVAMSGHVSYSIMENLATGGWLPVDWELKGEAAEGIVNSTYKLDRLFVVGANSPILSIDRQKNVNVDGNLSVNGSPVLSQSYFNNPQLAIGAGSMVGKDAYAIGSNTQATGVSSLALGNESSATGVRSVAIATGRAEGEASFAVGRDAVAIGTGAIALGGSSRAYANYATAMGSGQAIGFTFFANGSNAHANTRAEVALGANNIRSEINVYGWVDTDPIFGIGNSESRFVQSNAITILKNGQTKLTNKYWDGNSPTGAVTHAMGSGGKALVVEGHAAVKGNTVLEGKTSLKGEVIIENVQGDIPMGIYGR